MAQATGTAVQDALKRAAEAQQAVADKARQAAAEAKAPPPPAEPAKAGK